MKQEQSTLRMPALFLQSAGKILPLLKNPISVALLLWFFVAIALVIEVSR